MCAKVLGNVVGRGTGFGRDTHLLLSSSDHAQQGQRFLGVHAPDRQVAVGGTEYSAFAGQQELAGLDVVATGFPPSADSIRVRAGDAVGDGEAQVRRHLGGLFLVINRGGEERGAEFGEFVLEGLVAG